MSILDRVEAARKTVSQKVTNWFTQPDVAHTGHIPDVDPREQMREVGENLPLFFYLLLQQGITENTGKALSDVPPLVSFTTWHRQFFMWLQLGAGFVLIYLATLIGDAFWLLLPLAWLLIAACLRTMQVSFTHYGSHGTLIQQSKRWNDWLADVYAMIALSTPLAHYRSGHVGDGHHGKLNTESDPDSRFLIDNGFEPGKTAMWYWRHTFILLLSPNYYLRGLAARVKMNLSFDKGTTVWRPFYVVVIQLLIVLAFLAFERLDLYVLGWVIPMVVYHGLALLQNITEHNLAIVPGQPDDLGPETKYTTCRFFGNYHENRAVLILSLFKAWLAKLLTVGCTELCSHSNHHSFKRRWFYESDIDWMNAPYSRARAVKAGERYKETWGFRDALNHNFKALSNKR
ncbi:MAG: hypothetical protein Alis3KO_05500 [Aliiglaciecola sp.]